MDLVGVEGHWTLTEHAIFKCFKTPGFEMVWPRAASVPSCKFSGTRALLSSSSGGLWKGAGFLRPEPLGLPILLPGSLCVSGTRRGAPSGGGRLGSSLDFPRLNGCGGRG